MLRQLVEAPQLPCQPEHEFAGRRGLGMGYGEHGLHIGIEMMVDKHLAGRRLAERLLHLVDTGGSIEVEAEYEVGVGQGPVASLPVLVVANHFLAIGQPLQVVGILVGNNNLSLLAVYLAQVFGPSETGAESIAVGTLVTHAYNAFTIVDQGEQLLALSGGNKVF